MKRSIWALALMAGATVLSPASAQAQAPAAGAAVSGAPVDAQALATAREIIRTGFPEDKRPDMFNGIIDALTAQMRTVTLAKLNNDPKAKAIIDARLDKFIAAGKVVLAKHIPAFMDAYAQAYAREFSQPELEEILKFAQTPAGAHFLLRSSAVVADPAFIEANQAYMRQIQPLIETMQQDMVTELIEYFKNHPPKPSGHS